MCELKSYEFRLDGPLFRKQRELLLAIAETFRKGVACHPRPGDADLVEGLMSMTDEIADQAHDHYGIDCLLGNFAVELDRCKNDNRCDCEKDGFFRSGVPGILAHMENGRLAEGAQVNRCDLCQRYPSDEAAFERLRELGHVPS
jgi:hypothetical protein